MSIVIQNMGGPSDGVCTYELRINRDTICAFTHNRRDGLATCLRTAADAVDTVNVDEELRRSREARCIENFIAFQELMTNERT